MLGRTRRPHGKRVWQNDVCFAKDERKRDPPVQAAGHLSASDSHRPKA